MDNFVMLQVGDLIDASIGVTFSLSTLTAAGFGQVFSDVAGITCVCSINHFEWFTIPVIQVYIYF